MMASPVPGTMDPAAQQEGGRMASDGAMRLILSFDVEEHYRIEAAAGLAVAPSLKAHYGTRLEPPTRWLLEQLAAFGIKATFFIIGEIAQYQPALIRLIHQAGHEVASHGWDHRRVHAFTPESFRSDVRQSKDVLEQISGEAVVGYRAPTFSVMPQTAWALDVLAELGMLYDSSIYPVRHDRYGVPRAPRAPFRAGGVHRTILEIPPVTFRLLAINLPVGGGGYFRLFPLSLFRRALRQVERECRPRVAMLYFHPWEFDPRQPRLPLRFVSRFRTYVGIHRSQARFATLLGQHPHAGFARAVDVAKQLDCRSLPHFDLGA